MKIEVGDKVWVDSFGDWVKGKITAKTELDDWFLVKTRRGIRRLPETYIIKRERTFKIFEIGRILK